MTTTLPDLSPAARSEDRSPAGRLLALARDHYRPVLGDDGQAYAVPLSGPAVACRIGAGRHGLGPALSRLHYETTGRAPTGAAMGTALATLACQARSDASAAGTVPVAYRVARPNPGRVVVDLGRADGRCVLIEPGGWQLAERSPVPFRRSALTGQLPEPARGGALEDLQRIAHLPAGPTWQVVQAWLVAALLADIACPVLALAGPPGAGTSTAAQFLAELIDPSPAPLRRPPRDLPAWATAASGSRVIALDDPAPVSAWLAHVLTATVDGTGIPHRSTRAGDETAVLALQRPVIVTGHPDDRYPRQLATRTVRVPLQALSATERRPEADVTADFEAARPQLLGALLDQTARALAVLPAVGPRRRAGRLGEFVRVVAALNGGRR